MQNAPYTSGDIDFWAMNADRRLTDLLEAHEGTTLFVIDRIIWNKDAPITSVRLSCAPGYRMKTRI